MNKQILARIKRLHEGRCPIHGIQLSQLGYEQIQTYCDHCKHHCIEAGRSIEECPRRDCNIRAYGTLVGYELSLEFKYLLEE
jgi:hypothetical protein